MKIDPDAAGLDASRLERIGTHLRTRYIEPGKIVGGQVVVARHGEVGYFESFGERDRERSLPVVDETIWRIYSMTKPITGVALLSLYEHGHFQLTDPVHRFLPEWKGLRVKERADGTERLVEPERPMSIKDVLMHMSGLGMAALGGDGTLTGSLLDGDDTLADVVTKLADQPLSFHPGTRWLYGVSTDICGRLVEVISGQRFDDYLQEHVFAPLGMTDTGFTVADDALDRFAASYFRRPQDKSLKLVDDPETSRYRTPRAFLSGGGGLVSTTADYLRFAQMLCNGGELDGVRVLGRKTVELMTTNHLPGGGSMVDFAIPGGFGEVGFTGMGFGLTVAVNQGAAATGVIGSAGDFTWGGYASTIFWVDPAEELVVIFMTQLIPSGTFNFRDQLKALVYPAIVD
ncbi:MAG TPA: serine hydrolase domain-containing protein [Acidimicrobiales bacterium]|nr:serine hydrolase domain-containing protein [Acidimicrobiales bacterium]